MSQTLDIYLESKDVLQKHSSFSQSVVPFSPKHADCWNLSSFSQPSSDLRRPLFYYSLKDRLNQERIQYEFMVNHGTPLGKFFQGLNKEIASDERR